MVIGDLFYVGDHLPAGWYNDSSLPAGWYIVKDLLNYSGCLVIDMIDGMTIYVDLRMLHCQVRECYARDDFDDLGYWRPSVVRRYFELMDVPEHINWLAEGF